MAVTPLSKAAEAELSAKAPTVKIHTSYCNLKSFKRKQAKANKSTHGCSLLCRYSTCLLCAYVPEPEQTYKSREQDSYPSSAVTVAPHGFIQHKLSSTRTHL
jgi:uncharacterized Fe-S cluster-containing MiaB family protein